MCLQDKNKYTILDKPSETPHKLFPSLTPLYIHLPDQGTQTCLKMFGARQILKGF